MGRVPGSKQNSRTCPLGRRGPVRGSYGEMATGRKKEVKIAFKLQQSIDLKIQCTHYI